MGKLPFSMGGLVDYDTETKSKIQIKKTWVIGFTIAIVVFYVILGLLRS